MTNEINEDQKSREERDVQMKLVEADIEARDQFIRDQKAKIKELKEIVKDEVCMREADVDKLRRMVRGEDLETMSFPGPSGDQDVDNSWRSMRLESLRIKPRYLKALEKAGIETVGHLADFTSTKDLSFINGMGKAGADHIADVMEQFHASRQSSMEGQTPQEAA